MLPPVILDAQEHLAIPWKAPVKLPSKEFLKDFSQTSWFYGSFSSPSGAPPHRVLPHRVLPHRVRPWQNGFGLDFSLDLLFLGFLIPRTSYEFLGAS